MADNDLSSPDNERDERRQLMIRIASAGVVILVLLVGLAMWERRARPPGEPPSVASVSTPAEVRAAMGQSAPLAVPASLQSSVARSEQSPPASAASDVVEETQAPVVAEPTLADLPPGPEASVPHLPPPPKPAVVATPATQPKPPVGNALPPAKPVESPLPRPAIATSAANPAPRVAPLEAGASRLVIQAEPAPPGRTPPAGRAFALQAGVFANPANAEELRARLTLAGISSQVETRVLVGPFKSRQESFVAQNKLKAMGLDHSQLITIKQQ